MKKKKENNFPLMLRYMKGNVRWFVLALLFSVLSTVCNSATPQIISVTIDSILGSEQYTLPAVLAQFTTLEALRANAARTLLIAAGAIVGIAAIGGIGSFVTRTTTALGSEGFVKGLRDALYSHIQRLPYSWHVKNQTGDIIQRCTSDVEVIRNFFTNQLLEVIRIVFMIVYYLCIMFSMNWTIALISAVFIPIVVLYSMIFYSKINVRFRAADEAEGVLSTAVQENLTGVRVVRAFGRERWEVDRFNEKNRRFSNLWVELGKLMSVYWALGDLITGLQIMAVIAVGAGFAATGRISLGTLLAFISYNSALTWPIRSLGRTLSEMSKSGVSIDRVAYILKAEEEKILPNAETPPMNRDIEFKDVTFSYEGQKPVLNHLSFTIPAGKTFAILGGTGSGKSTIAALLDRLYDLKPGEGSISIGGVDIREIRQDYLRGNIGLVLQEPYLFSRSIGENIAITHPGSGLNGIKKATSIACVDEAIDTFSDGYDTIVGERGVTLSGGQKQRVAIARMLMQEAPVMIFDDSLSAVDAETDAKIREALGQRMSDSTVILISHRITTLMQADQILVLKDGELSEIGTHAELISHPGIYRDIYDIQMAAADRELLEDTDEAVKGGAAE
ncbi:MAG: ABC transporter ATP-binding protein/permease [Oscillospiraceae bacterium]|nr:ABC transporter ATP-binding protein/permease [Oscillospiraceae bacterium]